MSILGLTASPGTDVERRVLSTRTGRQKSSRLDRRHTEREEAIAHHSPRLGWLGFVGAVLAFIHMTFGIANISYEIAASRRLPASPLLRPELPRGQPHEVGQWVLILTLNELVKISRHVHAEPVPLEAVLVAPEVIRGQRLDLRHLTSPPRD